MLAGFEAPALTSVGSSLRVQADFQAPALTSVGSDLCVGAGFEAPALTSVGDWLRVQADFQAPALTSVGGKLRVQAEFQAPLLNARRLADDGEYQLWLIEQEYHAGCRRFTREQALAHWDRGDERAKLFRAAILADALSA